MNYSHIVIGGGVYGCFTALRLAELHPGARIAIAEREAELLLRASYNNQARVHEGYHYPRSMLTALRSRINAPRFMEAFSEAIHKDFQHYYAIGRNRSNITPAQFETFCRRVGACLRPAPPAIRALFEPEMIEAVYGVTEYAFDADILRRILRRRLDAAGIELLLGREVLTVFQDATHVSGLNVAVRGHSGIARPLSCGFVYNCTYASLNGLLARSGLSTVRLRHEATEMALVKPPAMLRRIGITVMCGPFFSLMPFPARGLSTLSHVSYTPHYRWTEEPGAGMDAEHRPAYPLASRFDRMRRDAARYLPAISDAVYSSSLWETKTILPQSDANDSRPILFKRDPSLPNVISLLGSKIDNIFDLEEALAAMPQPMPDASPV